MTSKKTPNARKDAAKKYAKEHGVKYTEALRAVDRSAHSAAVPSPFEPPVAHGTPMLRGYRLLDQTPVHRDVFIAGDGGTPGVEGFVGQPGSGKSMLAMNAVIEDALRGRTQIVVDVSADHVIIARNAEALGLDPKKIKVIDPAVLAWAVALDTRVLLDGPDDDWIAVEVLTFLLSAEVRSSQRLFVDVFEEVFARAVEAARQAGREVSPRGLLDHLAAAAADLTEEPHAAVDENLRLVIDGVRGEIANLAARVDAGSPLAAALFPTSMPAQQFQISRGDLLILAPPQRWAVSYGYSDPYPASRSERLSIVAMRLLVEFGFKALAGLPDEWEKALTVDPVDIFPHLQQDAWMSGREVANLAVRWTAMSGESLQATIANTDLLWIGQHQSREAVDILSAAGVRADERHMEWLSMWSRESLAHTQARRFLLADSTGTADPLYAVLPEDRLAALASPNVALMRKNLEA